MEISSQHSGESVVVNVKGRLDGYWADHLSKGLEEILRKGVDCIQISLREVTYISSLGIRVLVQFYKRLTAIGGSFVVSETSDAVKKVLDMAGLGSFLMPGKRAAAPAAPAAETSRQIDRPGVSLEVFDLAGAAARMECRPVGNPAPVETAGFRESDCRAMLFPENALAVGLGAFGNSFADCRGRFGEFLAVAGAAAYQPTDGSNVPDFLHAQGTFVPQLQVLYGLRCEGEFAWLGRFEAKADPGTVGLSELVEIALEIAQTEEAAVAIVAESAGLAGATLKKAPVEGTPGATLFSHPEIRHWLSFTSERAFSRGMALVTGVAARSGCGPLSAFLRPLRAGAPPLGHCHAAAFSYRPLQKGRIDLKKTVWTLFEEETLEGLLHLVGDDRGSTGVTESEFVRGAVWIAPLVAAPGKDLA